jgi:hypothetical protein
MDLGVRDLKVVDRLMGCDVWLCLLTHVERFEVLVCESWGTYSVLIIMFLTSSVFLKEAFFGTAFLL